MRSKLSGIGDLRLVALLVLVWPEALGSGRYE